MTTYTVHIHREMRFGFGGIEAASHEEAAAIAREMPTEYADESDDRDGEIFYALVEVNGHKQQEQSRIIDFEPERLRLAAPKLLAACRMIVDRWEQGDLAEAASGMRRRRRRGRSPRKCPGFDRSRTEALLRPAALPRLGQRRRRRDLLRFRRGPGLDRRRRRGRAAGGCGQRVARRRSGRLRPAAGDRRAQFRPALIQELT